MAHLVQTLTITAALICFSVSAYGATFSHKVHLAQKLPCLTCHGAASSSTKLEDNLLPSSTVCAGCHTGAQGSPAKLDQFVIKTPRTPFINRFNHQLHIKLGNAAPIIARAIDTKAYLSHPGDTRRHLDTRNLCVACHRGLDESESVTDAAFPRMADCLVCHNKVDPPFSCGKCHVEDARLKPANHTRDWIDVHSSGKANLDKPSCAVCHGRQFTCLGCH